MKRKSFPYQRAKARPRSLFPLVIFWGLLCFLLTSTLLSLKGHRHTAPGLRKRCRDDGGRKGYPSPIANRARLEEVAGRLPVIPVESFGNVLAIEKRKSGHKEGNRGT